MAEQKEKFKDGVSKFKREVVEEYEKREEVDEGKQEVFETPEDF